MTVPMTAAVDVVETEVIEVDFVVPWLRTLAPLSKEVEEAVDDVEDELCDCIGDWDWLWDWASVTDEEV